MSATEPVLHTDGNKQKFDAVKLGTTITVASGAASAQSSVVGAKIAHVVATDDCYIEIGSNPTAAATTKYLPANTPIQLILDAATDKIAAIQKSAAGTVHITPIV